ncbi:hypothetical protein JXA12_03385 [Candidatus Woesearchaeota archaeon]|nr:hypothetical protein [Candidatus Woesearchaeota archaeon]
MIRNKDLYEIPAQKDVCDDTFMPNFIHTKYGPGTIRTRYDAMAFYQPYISLREHFKIYRRIFLDLRHLDETKKEFKTTREMERTKIDWDYVFKQKPKVIADFLLYKSITGIEDISYRLLPKKGISDMWVYKKK